MAYLSAHLEPVGSQIELLDSAGHVQSGGFIEFVGVRDLGR
jgi:hypothetical protein